ncbi:MAG: metallophosphoesterase [Anaerovoracaceae bacterium]
MKFFVISDTHGKINKVREVYEKLNNIDLIIHLGDCEHDAKALEVALEAPVVCVKGNMDGSYSSDDFKTLETEYGKILLTHGHMDHVKTDNSRLLYRAEENNCKAVLFGHTHTPYYNQVDGIYLLNPGSLPAPRDGTQGSYGIITTTPTEFNCAIVYYSSLQGKNTKPVGGVLWDMLNNSDRF